MVLRPQPFVNRRHNLYIGLTVFIFTLVIYFLTFARSLSFWDAGEYITCSSILGIPHPPGNPFYILLGRFFTIFSLGLPHAQVVNFLSSILSALAVMFTYFFTVKLVTMFLKSAEEGWLAYLAGVIAALFTAFSSTFWDNAIEAEVYAGLAFTINLVVWLTLIWREKSENLSHLNWLLLIVYLFFLGFGIHQTSLQIAPAVLFIAVYPLLKGTIKTSRFWGRAIIYLFVIIIVYMIFNPLGKNIHIPDLAKYMVALVLFVILFVHLHSHVPAKVWWLALFLILAALSTHIFLLARSEHRPFINEGHPHNLKLFTDYVLRRQYGITSMFVRRASFWYQFKEQFLTYFSWQFFNTEMISRWFQIPRQLIAVLGNSLIFLLGLWGAVFHYRKNKHSFFYMAALFFMASLAMVFVMNLSDAEVRERDYFFVTAYNFWTVWLAIGCLGIIDYFRRKLPRLVPVSIILALALPLFNLASQFHVHDRSREYIALGYGQNILNSLEENAIVFTNGDNDTFPVWYAQAVYDPAAWEYIHPSAEPLPLDPDFDSAILAENQLPIEITKRNIERAMRYKDSQCSGIRKDVSVANLSLLNTPWYIKQLRDHEGIEFNIPDSHIDSCQDDPRSVLYPRQVPKDTAVTIKGIKPDDQFSITYKRGTVLYIKDLAVIQIIKDNYGKRPIYFAVTVPDVIGFDEHLRNEGMVDRLVSTRGENQYNLDRLISNIEAVYTYKGIFDDSIYKDRNMKRLLNNYGAAYVRASQFYHSLSDFDNSVLYLEKGMEFMVDKQRFYNSMSNLYLEGSFHFAGREEFEKSLNFLENAINYHPANRGLTQAIYRISRQIERRERGIELLEMIKPYQDSMAVNTYISLLQEED